MSIIVFSTGVYKRGAMKGKSTSFTPNQTKMKSNYDYTMKKSKNSLIWMKHTLVTVLSASWNSRSPRCFHLAY